MEFQQRQRAGLFQAHRSVQTLEDESSWLSDPLTGQYARATVLKKSFTTSKLNARATTRMIVCLRDVSRIIGCLLTS